MNDGERRRAEAVLLEADSTVEQLRRMVERLTAFTDELDRIAEADCASDGNE